MDVSYELRRRALVRVRAEVRGETRITRRAAEGPLVWDIVDRLVFVARRSKRVSGGLETDRVGILCYFRRNPTAGDGESVFCPGQRRRGDRRVVREQADVRRRVHCLEVFNLNADHPFSRGMYSDAEYGP